jgi:hypothetical protein
MPARPTRHRAAVWRELTRLRALSLHRSTWAVPHQEDGPPDLRGMVRTVREAHGRATAHEVDLSRPSDQVLQERLVETCEHLWDSFFNDVDRLAFGLAGGTAAPLDARAAGSGPADARAAGSGAADARAAGSGPVEQFDTLRLRWADLFQQDFLAGSASRRASARLAACAAVLWPAGAAAPPAPDRARRHAVGAPLVTVAQDDGRVRYVVPVQPMPSDDWERALASFEAFAYAADADRVALRQGIFDVCCAPAERDRALARLATRITVFDHYAG